MRKITTEILISRSEDNGHALLPHTEGRNEVNEAGAFAFTGPIFMAESSGFSVLRGYVHGSKYLLACIFPKKKLFISGAF